MKKTALLIILFNCYFCTPEINFESPPVFNDAKFPQLTTSLRAVQERIRQSPNQSLQFGDETPLWLEGFVTSEDLGGNFYKELYLQDAPNQPESALRILLDQSALSLTYPRGQKLYVKLNGLGAGYQNGMFSIGAYRVDGIGPLPQYLIRSHIERSTTSATLVPLPLPPEAFSKAHLGKWVEIADSQFVKSEFGKTFSGQAYDQFEGLRALRTCAGQFGFWASTSVYADFKSVVVPQGSGRISGILTRDYYDEKYIIKINSPANLEMTDSRCDPFFEAYFETLPLGQFAAEGWSNQPFKGTRLWQVYEDENSNGKSLKITAYGSVDTESDSWLIGPELDVRILSAPQLSFRTSTLYADKSSLEAYLLFGWTADQLFSDVEKHRLEARIANKGDDADRWIDSGPIDLSNITQPFRVAFRYQGSGKSTYDGTFELDDLRIVDLGASAKF